MVELFITHPWSISRTEGVQITQLHYLPETELLSDVDTLHHARSHPRGVQYRAPAGARALAHAAENPRSIITAHGALALYGVPFLVEGHDTVLVAPTSATKHGGLLTPTVVRRGVRADEAATFRIRGYPFRVARPAVAAIHVLKTLDGLPAIQLLDAVRRFTPTTPDDLLTAGKGRINRQKLEKLLRQSSSKADSPKETEMRLTTAAVAQRHGLTMVEQYPIHAGGRIVTVFDLILLEPQIGLMYDGQHHWEHDQRQKDAYINLEATAQGWTVLRFSSGTLSQLPGRLARILEAKGFVG